MVNTKKAVSALLFVLVSVLLVGCGGGVKRVVVTGKVVDGGKPLALTGPEYQEGAAAVEVAFYPDDPALTEILAKTPVSLSARVKPDGTFALGGGDGKGIPVGKYKVTLTNRNPGAYRPERTGGGGQGDAWGGKFSLDKTPFAYDIQSEQEIVLDVAKGGDAAPAPEAKS